MIVDYYEHVDRRVGELLAAPRADTHVLVVSDHGAQRMDGGIALNEWLSPEASAGGPARPRPRLEGSGRLGADDGLGRGGYYGRVFLNVRGATARPDRPRGLRGDRDRLSAELEALGDEGEPIGTRV